MYPFNTTNEFTFVDFSSSSLQKTLVAIGFLLTYTCTILENVVLMTVVYMDRSLHTPMYFFLGNFSFIECCLTTSVIPKTFYTLVTDNWTVPLWKCVLQLYTFTSFGAVECLQLGVMAYDRYVAICHPLHYSSMISRGLCIILVYSSWLLGFLCPAVPTYFVLQLRFCNRRLNHFFCDFPPLLEIACSSISPAKLSLSLSSSSIGVSSFIVIAFSYSRIVWAVLKMRSRKGLQKAISTCSSHFTVVCIYYISGSYVYVIPNTYETEASKKYVTLLYAVVTPLLNPFIYCFRNKDVLMAIRRVFDIKYKIVCPLYLKGTGHVP